METDKLVEIIENEIKKDQEQSLKDIVNILEYCFQMPEGDFRNRLVKEFVKIYKSYKNIIESLEDNN